MMTIECAISIIQRRAEYLQTKITACENETGIMTAFFRSELGAIRRLMYDVGMPKDKLPEVPYLEPEHLENYKARVQALKLGVAS